MRILVTGACGFIGLYTCIELFKLGYDVLGYDNLNDYYDPKLKHQNLERIKAQAKKSKQEFAFVKADIRNKATLKESFEKHPVAAVIHLAQNAGVRPSIEQPEFYFDVNVNGFLNLLETMRANSVNKLVYISSSSVYGNNKKVPFSETDNVDRPISPYAASKKACELMAHTYHALFDLDVVCLRYFTVYGPHQRPDLAINKFTRLILANKPIEMYGDGSSARDYTYVSDIVKGTLLALDYTLKNHHVYDIFNLGGSKPVKLKDLISKLYQIIGKTENVVQLPMQMGDVDITYSDYSHAKEVLGYEPEVDIDTGLREFVKWYRKEYNL